MHVCKRIKYHQHEKEDKRYRRIKTKISRLKITQTRIEEKIEKINIAHGAKLDYISEVLLTLVPCMKIDKL